MTQRSDRRRWWRRRSRGSTEPPGGDSRGAISKDRVSRRNSALVASGILLSRVTGLARERALGHFLGTSFAADAFTAAFRIPNLLQHLLGEGVLSASFIPVYSRLLAEGRAREASRVAGAIAGLLGAAAGALALGGILFAEPLTTLVAAGLQGRPRTFELTVALVRILFPGIGFLVLSAWCLGVLNSHGRFFLSYVAPVIFNLVQIGVLVGAGLTVFASDGGAAERATTQVSLATWLSVGTVVGGALQFLVQLPTVLRLDRELRPSLRTDLPGIRTTLRAFGPVVTARGVVQLSSYVQIFLASFLAAGALATLRYAQILYMLPISLFAMSVAAAELPELSRAKPGERDATTVRLQQGLARIGALVVPTALGYLVVGDLVTGALFQTGEFVRLDTIAVWMVLGGYSVGLLATTSSRLLQSALYGRGDTRTPARMAVVRVVVSAALGVVLMLQLDRLAITETGIRLLGDLPALSPLPDAVRRASGGGDLVRLGAAGLSVASGLAAWLEYAVLRGAVARTIGPTKMAGGQLRPILIAASISALVAGLARPLVSDLHPLVGGALAVGAMTAVYLVAARRLGVSEIQGVLAEVRQRLSRP
jgi:putative peptidoglycan lipid II flippase